MKRARCPFHLPGQSKTTLPDSRFPFPSWEGLGVGSDSRFPGRSAISEDFGVAADIWCISH
ncbi:MAG: hypothetical protein F6J94_02330 [Moorea sp. SIO1F2]|uniref:hypothetical protein n=1 Tax=unclassified Moorena TaxID=2683338 RepID=UPI0013B69456|nr:MULTISPECIES: hypothetical protein [unclassified Moorena]NEN98944.1 hypothetical protein [Moorena sp. SIO3I7]NEO07319.1 hypothetical protein [Moorena sp. SIO3I8]NEO24666.1 hypothetical protein [Moorena sp. SIO4A5]NEQ58809.1 hypothetical protein [Moorena sp. SIO4A1]NET80851.1 hypothetical protein [Moorena sp. SIO1F2]